MDTDPTQTILNAIKQHLKHMEKDLQTTTYTHGPFNYPSIEYRYPHNHHLCFTIHLVDQQIWITGDKIPLSHPNLLQQITQKATQHKQLSDTMLQRRLKTGDQKQ